MGDVMAASVALALRTAKRLQKRSEKKFALRQTHHYNQLIRRPNHMNQHLDSIDRQIAAKHLLTHPFYLA